MGLYIDIRTEEQISSSHFVQLACDDSPCKSLHGHTWKIIVEARGEIKPDGMLIDFRLIKDVFIKPLDHKVLLPDITSKTIYTGIELMDYNDKNVSFSFKNKNYMLPREDVVILKGIPVVTSEYLALYLKDKLHSEFPTEEFKITVFESDKSFAKT